MDKVRRFCGFLNWVNISSNGIKGDLSFGWKQDCVAVSRSFSSFHIDVLIQDDSEGNC